MAGHDLIDDHLAVLARRLPSDTVDELADGLTETWQHHLAAGQPPTEAARAAIAEFGTPEQIIRAFVAQAPGRRIALRLLAVGPVVGVCWGASLSAAHAWQWSVPGPLVMAYGLGFLAVIGLLLAGATSRRSYRRARLGSAGGLGMAVLDLSMVVAALTVAPALVWPMALAIPASLARTGITLSGLRR